MKYQTLLTEYRDLLAADVHLQQELHCIPKGYLVTKKISGREYLYLQYSVQGKKKSEYVREEDEERIRAAIVRREPAKAELSAVRQNQDRLERAVRILDPNLYRTFVFLKQSAEMDALPVDKRLDALAFAKAMTALEGLPVKEETEQNLLLWAAGKKRFTDFYIQSLCDYGILEDM